MKNPKWQRDELVLALDVYFKNDYNKLNVKHPIITELSSILNTLPIFNSNIRTETFRNPEGVYMKLGNFLAIDPDDIRKGLPGYGKLDEIIFREFVNKKEELSAVASIIREAIRDEKVSRQLTNVNEFDQNDSIFSKEGKVIYRLHRLRERDSKIVRKKKEQVLKEKGTLACEVCSFDFDAYYKEFGRGFIECHHIKPISHLEIERITKLEDLALVCSNCHSMLHANSGITVGELRRKISLVSP